MGECSKTERFEKVRIPVENTFQAFDLSSVLACEENCNKDKLKGQTGIW